MFGGTGSLLRKLGAAVTALAVGAFLAGPAMAHPRNVHKPHKSEKAHKPSKAHKPHKPSKNVSVTPVSKPPKPHKPAKAHKTHKPNKSHTPHKDEHGAVGGTGPK